MLLAAAICSSFVATISYRPKRWFLPSPNVAAASSSASSSSPARRPTPPGRPTSTAPQSASRPVRAPGSTSRPCRAGSQDRSIWDIDPVAPSVDHVDLRRDHSQLPVAGGRFSYSISLLSILNHSTIFHPEGKKIVARASLIKSPAMKG